MSLIRLINEEAPECGRELCATFYNIFKNEKQYEIDARKFFSANLKKLQVYIALIKERQRSVGLELNDLVRGTKCGRRVGSKIEFPITQKIPLLEVEKQSNERSEKIASNTNNSTYFSLTEKNRIRAPEKEKGLSCPASQKEKNPECRTTKCGSIFQQRLGGCGNDPPKDTSEFILPQGCGVVIPTGSDVQVEVGERVKVTLDCNDGQGCCPNVLDSKNIENKDEKSTDVKKDAADKENYSLTGKDEASLKEKINDSLKEKDQATLKEKSNDLLKEIDQTSLKEKSNNALKEKDGNSFTKTVNYSFTTNDSFRQTVNNSFTTNVNDYTTDIDTSTSNNDLGAETAPDTESDVNETATNTESENESPSDQKCDSSQSKIITYATTTNTSSITSVPINTTTEDETESVNATPNSENDDQFSRNFVSNTAIGIQKSNDDPNSRKSKKSEADKCPAQNIEIFCDDAPPESKKSDDDSDSPSESKKSDVNPSSSESKKSDDTDKEKPNDVKTNLTDSKPISIKNQERKICCADLMNINKRIKYLQKQCKFLRYEEIKMQKLFHDLGGNSCDKYIVLNNADVEKYGPEMEERLNQRLAEADSLQEYYSA